MKRKSEFPITVKSGSARVKIYKSTSKGYPYFKVCYYIGGKRKTQNFANLEDAKQEANIQAAKISRGDIDGVLLSGKDRLVYGRALEAIRGLNVTLDAAATDYADARKTLGQVRLAEAARFYMKHHGGRIVSKPVKDVVEELKADATARNLSKAYVADLDYRGGRFADAFSCPINSVSPDEVREFLATLKLSSRSHNNFLTTLRTLFEFARTRNYVAKDYDPLEGLKKHKDAGGAIEIFSPQEMAKLLAHAEEDLIAPFAIGAFAGLRQEEILRLDWQEVRLPERFIEVTAGKAKTAARRLVPVAENLAAWLAPRVKKEGKVWPHSKPYLHEARRNAATDAEVKWKENGLRHSYISYRLAEVQDVAKVALEAGNSPQMIFRHYRELVRPTDADRWFAIRLNTGKKAIPIPTEEAA